MLFFLPLPKKARHPGLRVYKHKGQLVALTLSSGFCGDNRWHLMCERMRRLALAAWSFPLLLCHTVHGLTFGTTLGSILSPSSEHSLKGGVDIFAF